MNLMQFRREWKVAVAVLVSALLCLTMSKSGMTAYGQQSIQENGSGKFQKLADEAMAERDSERLDVAVPLFIKALALRPDWAEGWWSLGTIYYDTDRYSEAIPAFEKVASLQPSDGTNHLMLGLSLYELKRNAEAANHLALARASGIQNAQQMEPVLMFHESMLALRAGRFETANQSLHLLSRRGVQSEEIDLAYGMSVLMLQPDALPPATSSDRVTVQRVGQAEAADSLETHQTAKSMYASLVASVPAFPRIHFAYGRFLLSIQEPDAALLQFQQELQRNPNDVRSKLEIAAIHYRNDSAAGIPFAEAAVSLDPQYPFAHYLLGLLYLDAENASAAIPQLEGAHKMLPEEPQIAFALASAYSKVHRKEEAAALRAEFTRLQAKAKEQGGPAYYGAEGTLGVRIGDRETGRNEAY